MANSEVPTGDQIVKDIKGKSADDSFADIAREVHTMLDHRNSGTGPDLEKINDALQAQGILPGFELTGVQGADFVGKDAEGHTVRVDSTDLSHVKVDTTVNTAQVNGRDATINPDGSGEITVKSGDSLTRIAGDVLRSQGNNDPDDREIANLVVKMQGLNGKGMIHPGDVLKLPPAIQDGIDSSFFGARALDTLNDTKTQLTSDLEAAQAAMLKTDHWNWGAPYSMNMDEINRGLSATDLTEQQRRGYQYLKDNFNEIAVDGNVWGDKLTEWNTREVQEAELAFFKNTNGGMM